MSRAIPAPTKGKKKAPPPPRPLQSIVIQQTIALDQPEQERPQNLMPIQNTPINPLEQETAGLIRNAPKEEATLLPLYESLAEGQPARVQDSANSKQVSNQPQLEETKVEKNGQSFSEGPFQLKTEEPQITIELKQTIASLPRKAPAPPKIKGVKKVPPPKAPILSQPPPLSSVEKATQQEVPKQIDIQKEPEAILKVEPPTEVKQTPLANIQAPTQTQNTIKKQQQSPIIQKPQLITPQQIREKPLENREIQAPPKASKPEPSRQLSPIKQLPGKSGISAKLQELRKAKERMLREDHSDIDENQDEVQVSNNRSDFIKQNELQDKKEKVSPKEELSSINETTPNPFQASSKQGIQDNEAPAKKITPAPFKTPAARIAPPQSKKVAPPPTLKSIPKPPEVKNESSNIEKQQSQIQPLLQPTDSPKTAEVNEKEGARKQQVQVKQIKRSDAVRNSVIIASPPEEVKADIQIQKLLERYHSLKAGYLNNLRQLDQLIHFQKQQEDNQIDKINHLLSELHRRNESLKVICSSQELPSADTEELPI